MPFRGQPPTYAAPVSFPGDRYGSDVLKTDRHPPRRPVSTELVVVPGQVLEDATTGFCGAVLRWENGLVVLEDRHGKRRSFPFGAGLLFEGRPVLLKAPLRSRAAATRTASGSVVGPASRAKTALPTRF
jgi:hypothetical protein